MISARTNATRSQRAIGVTLFLFFVVITAALVSSATSAPNDVEQRVEAILSKMTLDQKIDMLGGLDDFYIRAYPELGLPRLRMADGPIGVRHGGPATTLAGGISLAASWDPALAAEEGTQIARDARAKGVHFMLGTGLEHLSRSDEWPELRVHGRRSVSRRPNRGGIYPGNAKPGRQRDGKTFHGQQFRVRSPQHRFHHRRAHHARNLPARIRSSCKTRARRAVMDSYNLINGAHMTQNGFLNSRCLKKEWGFHGILMSDWMPPTTPWEPPMADSISKCLRQNS